jgi:hypothetical protein
MLDAQFATHFLDDRAKGLKTGRFPRGVILDIQHEAGGLELGAEAQMDQLSDVAGRGGDIDKGGLVTGIVRGGLAR